MIIRTLFRQLASIGSRPGDTEDQRLQKSILVLSCIPFMIAGFIWGLMYIAFGEASAGLIPFCYAVFSFFSLVHFGITKSFSLFRFNQLLLILILPFALMTMLGGFVQGSAVILWGFISPLGAVMFDKAGRAVYWFVAYLFLVILSGLIPYLYTIQCVLSPSQIHLFFVINFAGVSILVFLMFYYFVKQKNFFQQRTEELLLNILPVSIARELREKGKIQARAHAEITVLFTDFKNFSVISSQLDPQQLVNEIHQCYTAFDAIVERYEIEKIKTIGDSYMCAAGLVGETSDHAARCVQAGLEMCLFMDALAGQRRQAGLPFFEVRVGVHSGPVVAGIVGTKKFAYDIWGDTVNIASRMESYGEEGKVNISEATYNLVKDTYACVPRGPVEVKGKGTMEMYFVEGAIQG